MKKMLFIFNPRSGKEQIKNRLPDILDIFCKAGYLPEVYVTQGPGDGAGIVEKYGGDADLLVCSGGDGTLNSVISGMMGLEKPPLLGYIPSGSTNDFARSLGIPSDLKKAACLAVGGEPYPLDIGKFGDGRYFAYIAAFGAFTEVSYRTPQESKNLLGHQAYMLECVKYLTSFKSQRMRVEWEEGVIESDFIFGMVTNTISVGGFKGLVNQNVALNDGLFEVLLIRSPRAPSDLANIVSYMFLKEEENEYVFKFKSRKLTVISEQEVSWVLDGEYGGSPKEIVIENLSRAIQISDQEKNGK